MKETLQKRNRIPVKNPIDRENQLINLAYEAAEEKIRNGTASSQIITEFLRRGTIREQLENERLRADLEVAKAKVEQLKSTSDSKKMYEEVLEAMKRYSGNFEEDEEYYDEDDYY